MPTPPACCSQGYHGTTATHGGHGDALRLAFRDFELHLLLPAGMAACVTPRAPPTATTVFIYDAYTLRRNVVRALGHAAAHKYDRYFAIAENPILINALLRKNAALDPDYATGFLQRELRHVLAARWPSVRVVDRPADADLVFWMVWDFAFCSVFSPIEALAWEAQKGTLWSTCTEHAKMLAKLQQSPRWQKRGGRDFVFLIDDPHQPTEYGSR
jgi:hypothetical protein